MRTQMDDRANANIRKQLETITIDLIQIRRSLNKTNILLFLNKKSFFKLCYFGKKAKIREK